MKYAKLPLSIADQLTLIESRGINIPDRQKAEKYLSNISYYRLSAYMLPFKAHGKNEFLPDVIFDDVLDLYLFDRQL